LSVPIKAERQSPCLVHVRVDGDDVDALLAQGAHLLDDGLVAGSVDRDADADDVGLRAELAELVDLAAVGAVIDLDDRLQARLVKVQFLLSVVEAGAGGVPERRVAVGEEDDALRAATPAAGGAEGGGGLHAAAGNGRAQEEAGAESEGGRERCSHGWSPGWVPSNVRMT
jgi:hypothetical protein